MEKLSYADYIKFLDKQGYLEDIGQSDDLVEIALNPIVQVLSEQFRRLDLDKDVLVEVAYDIINNLETKFKYYADCMVAEGFEYALWEVAEINSGAIDDLNNKIIEEN